MKTRIQLFDDNRRLTEENEELRQKLAVTEKQLSETLQVLKHERDKFGEELRDRADKAAIATNTLREAKRNSWNALTTRPDHVTAHLVLGMDQAIERLK